MPTQRIDIETIEREEASSILDPATIHKQLKGSTLHSVAFGGLRHIGSASFAARLRGRKKKND